MSKFCGNCGMQLEDDAKVCGYCGTPFPEESGSTFAPTPTFTSASATKKPNGLAKILVALVAVIAVVVGIVKISSISYEDCDWCGNKPTKVYTLHDGGKAYVCKDCRSECFFCGEKAKKHYENMLGMLVFVCKDCYDEIA